MLKRTSFITTASTNTSVDLATTIRRSTTRRADKKMENSENSKPRKKKSEVAALILEPKFTINKRIKKEIIDHNEEVLTKGRVMSTRNTQR